MTDRNGGYTAEWVEKELGPQLLQAMLTRGPGSKWTPERQARILYAAHLGFDQGQSSAYAGISRMTLSNWHDECPELRAMFFKAAAGGCVHLVKRLEQADDPLVDRWRLERMSKSHAPPAKRVETTIEAAPVKIELVMKDAQGSEIPVPPEISGEVEEESE